MAEQQYGLTPEHPYPTTADKCGCIRIVNEHVIDYCQRHVLNEILQALKGISTSVYDAANQGE